MMDFMMLRRLSAMHKPQAVRLDDGIYDFASAWVAD
jgi:hypothetical protein